MYGVLSETQGHASRENALLAWMILNADLPTVSMESVPLRMRLPGIVASHLPLRRENARLALFLGNANLASADVRNVLMELRPLLIDVSHVVNVPIAHLGNNADLRNVCVGNVSRTVNLERNASLVHRVNVEVAQQMRIVRQENAGVRNV